MLKDLIKTALMGTNRMTPSVQTLRVLNAWGIDATDLPEAVLLGIGTADLVQKSGYILPNMPTEQLQAAAESERGYLPPALFVYAHELLKGGYKAILPEFLQAVLPLNKDFFPALLPELLDAGTAQKAYRPFIIQLLGTRGKWLATQQKSWSWALKTTNLPSPMPTLTLAETQAQWTDLQKKSHYYQGMDMATQAAWREWSVRAHVEIFPSLYQWAHQSHASADKTIQVVLMTVRYRREMLGKCADFKSA